MKKVYYLGAFIDNKHRNLREIISNNFDDFSLKEYQYIYRDASLMSYNAYSLYFESLNQINDYMEIYKNTYTNYLIVEYLLSDNDFYNLFFNKKIKSKPTNAWYFWFDEKQQKFKEIPKVFI